MMNLLNDVLIRCDCCGKIFTIQKENLDIENCCYDHGDICMGEEIEYRIIDYTFCPICKNEIVFRISGYEYPAGAFNYEDNEIKGGVFAERPQMAIIYYHNEFDTFEAYSKLPKIQQLILDIARDKELIYKITPREFEEVVEQVLKDEGFETTLTKQTHDGGRDIIATKYSMGKPIVFYVECKRYGKENVVGVNIVRALYGVQAADKINKSILVTTEHITSDAQSFVESQNTMMSLIDANEFYRLLQISASRYEYVY